MRTILENDTSPALVAVVSNHWLMVRYWIARCRSRGNNRDHGGEDDIGHHAVIPLRFKKHHNLKPGAPFIEMPDAKHQ